MYNHQIDKHNGAPAQFKVTVLSQPAQGPDVPGYPGGHEHQKLPGQGSQLSQQQGRIQAGSHCENQKTNTVGL